MSRKINGYELLQSLDHDSANHKQSKSLEVVSNWFLVKQ